jgi:hypothetical protein
MPQLARCVGSVHPGQQAGVQALLLQIDLTYGSVSAAQNRSSRRSRGSVRGEISCTERPGRYDPARWPHPDRKMTSGKVGGSQPLAGDW